MKILENRNSINVVKETHARWPHVIIGPKFVENNWAK
jgi:hypothetical protein